MLLKRAKPGSAMGHVAARLTSPPGRRRLVLVAYSLSLVALGALVYHWAFVLNPESMDTLRSLPARVRALPQQLRAVFVTPAVEHLTIDIAHDDFMRLAYQRELALRHKVLVTSDDDFVPARVRHDGRTIRVRLRLKGDSIDHLDSHKWSYRIRVRGDNTLLGMKQFSIQHPKTRRYVYEWIFHQALRREGLPALRYDFVKVTLNGEDLGIYALEEHFEKRLIEHNALIEGPVVRLNEGLLWSEAAKYEFNTDYIIAGFQAIEVDAFQTNDLLQDPVRREQHMRALALLEAFRRGEMSTSEVFDTAKLARFLAVVDLVGAQHSVNWGNMRFYYNPVTSRLEPIGFDGDSGRHIRSLSVGLSALVEPQFLASLFNDLQFYRAYITELERVSRPEYREALLTDIDAELKRYLAVLRPEFPEFRYSPNFLLHNQHFIEKVLDPIKGLHAYYRDGVADRITLELGNLQSLPVEVLGLTYKGSTRLAPTKKELILPEKPVSKSEIPVEYRVATFDVPAGLSWSPEMAGELSVDYRLLGTNRVRQDAVFPWSHLDRRVLQPDVPRQTPNVERFDFLEVHETSREIRCRPGRWRLSETLVVPSGYRFVAGEGTRIELENGASVVSYSPLQLVGSGDRPVVVVAADTSGQGVVVLGADGMSVLRHVVFEDLASPSHAGWQLLGAVTFYESPLSASQVTFLRNRSEDALHVVRSEFTVEDSRFVDAASDAFDADFSHGTVQRTHFARPTNDAIDVSGSRVEIVDVRVENAGDKALSAGENSRVNATGLVIRDSFIAVASKDWSRVSLQQSEVRGCDYGLTAFQKKPEFGAGSIAATGLQITETQVPFLVEQLSEITVDGQAQAATATRVEELLYGEPAPPAAGL